MSKKIRIIHIPNSVGGNPQGLSRHLKILGYDSESWILKQNIYDYAADVIIHNASDGFLKRELKKLWALRYVLIADVVFFNFGSTLFNPYPYDRKIRLKDWLRITTIIYSGYTRVMHLIEILILRLRDVLILVQYQGDDARQGDYCAENFEISIAGHIKGSKYYSPDSDELKRKRVGEFEKICFKIYALNPDLLYVLPKEAEFLPYSHISMEEWPPNYNQGENRPLRIGHAPSHRGAKGTDAVLQVIDSLKHKGYNFEFILIEGLDNESAKNLYKTIDVLVDQLYAGWYGGLAVECMALGKPVATYIRKDDLRYIPKNMRSDLPVINVTADTLEIKLIGLLEMNRSELLILAERSRSYVEKWHDPLEIANRVANDIEIGLRERGD